MNTAIAGPRPAPDWAGVAAGWGPAAQAAWQMWLRWCAATDRPAGPATADTLAAFVSQAPAAASTIRYRLSTICRAHRQMGAPILLDTQPPDRPWRMGPQWLNVDEALERCPTDGWPAGFRGRRDAWLIVLCGLCGLSRRDARFIKSSQIRVEAAGIRVAEHLVPFRGNEDPLRCPACAVTRWLRVVGEADLWGRNAAKALLVSRAASHDCEHPVADLPWRQAWVLTPGIDQWGWFVHVDQPMTARQVSAVLAARQTRPTSPSSEDDVAPEDVDPLDDVCDHEDADETGGRDDLAEMDTEDLLELLDERTRVADEALRKIEEALAADTARFGR